ncbi:MAG: hypothetical protein R6U70_03630 [Bacillota bacterium]
MLYFLSEVEREDNYFSMYNRALRSHLTRRRIPFREIALVGSFRDQVRKLNAIPSQPEDAWLLSCAHNPVIAGAARKPGKRFGHAHDLEAGGFAPAGQKRRDPDEERALSHYDVIFVDSEWARDLIARRYPRLSAEVVVSGFPFDREALQRVRRLPKAPNLVAFNQRFSLGRLHILEVHVAERLASRGYQVIHLCPREALRHMVRDRESRVLYRQGQMRGLNFVINDTKAEYYANLSRARVLVTTSAADTLSVGTLEAAALGVTPLAPRWGPFPEYLPREHLYPPYNVERLLQLVADPPGCRVEADAHTPERVFDIYLEHMEVT